MDKKPVTWAELIKIHSAKKKELGEPAGLNNVVDDVRKEWKLITSGEHSEYSQGTSSSKSSSSSKKIKKGHKGAPSITRPGHIDFRTHKGSKYYHRDGHLENYNREGVVGTPFVGPKHTTKKHKKKGKKNKSKKHKSKKNKSNKKRNNKKNRGKKNYNKTRKSKCNNEKNSIKELEAELEATRKELAECRAQSSTVEIID